MLFKPMVDLLSNHTDNVSPALGFIGGNIFENMLFIYFVFYSTIFFVLVVRNFLMAKCLCMACMGLLLYNKGITWGHG